MLINRGVFYDAEKIMDYAIPKIDAEFLDTHQYKITWDRPREEYPDAMYAALFLTHIKRHVREWALANKPKAFWLPAFND